MRKTHQKQLPTGLSYTWDLTPQGSLTKTYATHSEFPEESTWAPTDITTAITTHRKFWLSFLFCN